nr:MAG TPA: hypothetical protein [Caudoviricetes sp.]
MVLIIVFMLDFSFLLSCTSIIPQMYRSCYGFLFFLFVYVYDWTKK